MRQLTCPWQMAVMLVALVPGVACGGSVAEQGGGTGGTAGQGGGDGGGAGGAGASGTGGCADVCALYGPPCCDPAIPCPAPGDECVLEILGGTVDSVYTYEELEQEVALLEQYVDMTLIDTGVAAAAMEPTPAARMDWMLTADGAGFVTFLPSKLSHPFVLRCGGERMFVGLVYEEGGAAALAFPVLHVHFPEPAGPPSLRFGAWQGAWLGVSWDPDIERHIDHPEIRGRFCHRGILLELTLAP